jgi:hypothetical protein
MSPLANLLFLAFVMLCGCEAQPEREMVFEVRVGNIAPEVTTALVDGEPQAFVIEGSSSFVEVTRTYPSYQDALVANETISIQLLNNVEIVRSGNARPGACQQLCRYPWCPTVAELTLEHLYYNADADFEPLFFKMMLCEGNGKRGMASY